jgi:hypothetical protein
VPSPSKCHSWLGPPWDSKMRTLPFFTSSTNLGTKTPHFRIFLALCNVNQFALSHWFSYCLHECMNERINGSLLIWTTALKWGTMSCWMRGPEVRYKWDVSEEPATLRWRQSASPQNCKIFTRLRGVTFQNTPLISSAARTLVVYLCTWLAECISNGCFSGRTQNTLDEHLTQLSLYKPSRHIRGAEV